MAQTTIRSSEKLAGIVLPLVMVFLAMLIVMAASTLQGGLTEYQIAGNDRFREAAFQRAQGIASQTAGDIQRFPLTSALGVFSCNYTIENSSCVPTSIASFESAFSDVGGSDAVFYEVERLPPLLQSGFVARERQQSVSSSLAYETALFEIRVRIDAGAGNLGSSGVARGIAVLTQSSPGNSAE